MLHKSINIAGLITLDTDHQPHPQPKKKIIVVNNFFCENNICICEKIKESIPSWSNNYNLLTSAIFLFRSNQLKDIKREKKEKEQDLYLLEYETNEEELMPFAELKRDSKKYIFTIITSYQKLLRSLLLLQKNNIVHFNINYETICFKKEDHVLLRDFTHAIDMNRTPSNIIRHLIESINNITTNSPVEIHLLSHMKKHALETVTLESIQTICKTYINNPYLFFLSESTKEKLYINSMDSLKPCIGLPREKITDEILKMENTWDNYSLSIVYLHAVSSILTLFKPKSLFFRDFFRLLHTTIMTKRKIPETIDAFDSLFFKHTDWNKFQLSPES